MCEINIPLPTSSYFHVGYCTPEIKKEEKKRKRLRDTGHCETQNRTMYMSSPEILMECYCAPSRKPIRDEKSTFVNHKHHNHSLVL